MVAVSSRRKPRSKSGRGVSAPNRLVGLLVLLAVVISPCVAVQTFGYTIIASGAGFFSVSTGDIDGDGKKDVIVGRTDSKIDIYKTNGDGTFTYKTSVDCTSGTVYSVATADIDGDGDLDIVASPGNNKIYWFPNNGNWSFGSKDALESGNSNTPCYVFPAQLNNAGRIDVVAACQGAVKIFINNGAYPTAVTWTKQEVANYDKATSVGVADLDGDGDSDVIVGHDPSSGDDRLAWYKNDPVGTFALGGTIYSPSGYSLIPSAVSLGTIDSGTTIDVVLAEQGNGVTAASLLWFSNSGGASPTFTKYTVSAPGDTTARYRGIAVADLDDDGDKDVAYSDKANGKVYWAANSGAGVFGTPTQFTGGTCAGAEGLHVVDIDGDGDNDLLAACETDTRLVWWGAASINDPPVNSVPGDQSVEKDVDLTFNSANSNLTWIFAPPTPLRN